ncbi:VIT domain-containing protein, partial [Aliiglaciecola lipolytica]|uniref:VIT domain-containing protein n=1 Tax=Aliiglaciecola lipolytica TaxID=477689 RepID=UPI00059133D2
MQPTSSITSILQQAKIDIEIDAPVANTLLSQTFVNQTEDIIEAVYNFPVPRQAVIMQVKVSVNNEVFKGQIKPVTEAEEQYETGIEEGKRSVLIRDIGDGQHELRAGNLAPEDCIVIHIQIAQLMQAQPGGYRYFLPTVIAPKYGHAGDLRDVAHQQSLLASYPFSASLKVNADAGIYCVSHNLKQQDEGYQLEGELDQDIVLTVASQH